MGSVEERFAESRAGNSTRIAGSELAALAEAVLAAAGLRDMDAETVASALMSAEFRGTASHGLVRLPFLVARLREGGANASAKPFVVTSTAATAVVDGDRALGPVTSAMAMRVAIEKARSTGAGIVVARNSDFFGTCAHPAMMAAEKIMVGVVWTNGNPGMAAWGGAAKAIGNNPLGIAVPRETGGALVLDMAMSVSAGGRIRLAARRGEKIPADWMMDRDGNPTDDPNEQTHGGALLPLGHKGFGLAVMGEVLAGILSGAAVLSDIPAWFAEPERPVGNGHIHIVMDIAAFGDVATFCRRVEDMAARLKSTRLRPGATEIRLPGERAARSEERQRVKGVALAPETARSLVELARSLGVDAAGLAPGLEAFEG